MKALEAEGIDSLRVDLLPLVLLNHDHMQAYSHMDIRSVLGTPGQTLPSRADPSFNATGTGTGTGGGSCSEGRGSLSRTFVPCRAAVATAWCVPGRDYGDFSASASAPACAARGAVPLPLPVPMPLPLPVSAPMHLVLW